MIQKVLTSIGGVGVYGVISVTLFFAVFLGVLVWAFGLKRSYLESMSRLPLEEDPGREPGSETISQPEIRHE